MENTTPIAVLVEQAQAGDKRAFDALVRQLHERVWRSALVMCGDPEAARDLVQESWLEAWKSLPRFDGRCQFSTWMHGILRHRYLKLLRRDRRKPLELWAELPRDTQTADVFLPGDELAKREDYALLSEMLSQLPEKHRRVIELRFFANASLADIARVMGCFQGTVKSRLHHGLKKLRENPRLLNLLGPDGK